MASNDSKAVPPPSSSLGYWLPKDRAHIRKWLATKLKQFDEKGSVTFDPSIVALEKLVTTNPYLSKLTQDMFSQIPPAYVNDPTGKPQIEDFTKMLGLVDMILKEGPQWFDVPDQTAVGLIGFPINAILDWPMGTLAGFTFFLNAEVNTLLQGILNTWGQYLKSPASLACLNQENGWLSSDAVSLLAATANNDGQTDHIFQDLYVCNPMLPYFGFRSWDDFFTRKFKPGIRPLAYPDDQPTPDQSDPTRVIVSACESSPLPLATNVKLHDTFWIKQQPYSLSDMLNNDPLTAQFAGGTVYQAFLSALSYHRWHAPVSGAVVRIQHVPGTYYSENLSAGGFGGPDGPDPNAPDHSQPYLTAVATRGIIFIQADNPTIGLMAIVFVGMAEVSSCEFTVGEGQRVTKGQEIGMFHFGGSTHCLAFRPETGLGEGNFVNALPKNSKAQTKTKNVPVLMELAVVPPPFTYGEGKSSS